MMLFFDEGRIEDVRAAIERDYSAYLAYSATIVTHEAEDGELSWSCPSVMDVPVLPDEYDQKLQELVTFHIERVARIFGEGG